MHTINKTRQQLSANNYQGFDVMLADIFSNPGKPPRRRREDKESNNEPKNPLNDTKTIVLLIIMTVLIAALTALAVVSVYCDFVSFDNTNYHLMKAQAITAHLSKK